MEESGHLTDTKYLTGILNRTDIDEIAYSNSASLNRVITEYKISNPGNKPISDSTLPLFEPNDESTIHKEPFTKSSFSNQKTLKPSKDYSRVLQSWRGSIIKIDDDSFEAELEDLTNPGTLEIANIEFDAISPDDKKNIQIGTQFYWNIGYVTRIGQVRKESIIRFLKIIEWDEEDFNYASDRASQLCDELKFD